jgi:hypothetical protein
VGHASESRDLVGPVGGRGLAARPQAGGVDTPLTPLACGKSPSPSEGRGAGGRYARALSRAA